MNSKNSATSDPYRILLSLTDKTNLKRSDILLYQIVTLLHMEKFKNVMQRQ